MSATRRQALCNALALAAMPVARFLPGMGGRPALAEPATDEADVIVRQILDEAEASPTEGESEHVAALRKILAEATPRRW